MFSLEITESQLSELENIINEQAKELTELQHLSTNQKVLTLKEKEINKRLTNELSEAKTELTEQNKSLKTLERKTLLNKIVSFFIGIVTGGGIFLLFDYLTFM